MSEPMTRARLEGIRAYVEALQTPGVDLSSRERIILDLLAEVERLRADDE